MYCYLVTSNTNVSEPGVYKQMIGQTSVFGNTAGINKRHLKLPLWLCLLSAQILQIIPVFKKDLNVISNLCLNVYFVLWIDF